MHQEKNSLERQYGNNGNTGDLEQHKKRWVKSKIMVNRNTRKFMKIMASLMATICWRDI
jgi:hypothetical protein